MEETQNTNQQNKAGGAAPQQDPRVAQTQTAQPQMNTAPAQQSGGKSTAFLIGIVVVVLAIAGVAVWYFMWGPSNDALTFSGNGTENQAASAIMHEGPVARVNGEEVGADAYNAQVTQIVAQATQQGVDVNDATVQEQIQEQALTTVVNTELVMQAATAAGVSVSDADVTTQYDQLVESVGGQEEFAARLSEANLTETELRENLRNDLMVQGYLAQAVDTSSLEVSDAEVAEFYETISTQQEGVPPLEEVRTQIEQQLLAQKEQEAVGALIEELRAQANIEVLIS